MKKVVLVHGWGSSPDGEWLPWLRDELENRGFEVLAPEMPGTDDPKIKDWVEHLKNVVPKTDKNVYFVGHSIGCQTILRFLCEPDIKEIGGAVFVAGWFHIKGLDKEDVEVARPWIEGLIDLGKVRKKIGQTVAIFSDNDPFVPIDDAKIFKEGLGAKVIIERNKGHFTDEEGITELPVVLDELLRLITNN